MPPPFPGVYVSELASGPPAIAGVATSVCVLVGTAPRGPVNRLQRVASFAEYTRRFGGLEAGSELSFAAQLFFANGGIEAHVVRVRRGAVPASVVLRDSAGRPALRVTAADEGASGNAIGVEVDYETKVPGSTFRLRITQRAFAGAASSTEIFSDLTLESGGELLADTVVTANSQLVTVERLADPRRVRRRRGRSTSAALVDAAGALLDVASLVDATHNEFRLQCGTGPLITIAIDPAELRGSTPQARLTALCRAIRVRAQAAAGGHAAYAGALFCSRAGQTIRFVCGETGEHSRVRVLPGLVHDVTARLRLGSAQGGSEADAMAMLRPRPCPAVALRGGGDGTFDPTDPTLLVGDPATRVGLHAADALERFNLAALPGIIAPAVLQAAAAYCEARRAFLLLDAPVTGAAVGDTTREVLDALSHGALPDSRNAAVFFPWVRVPDPSAAGQTRLTAPAGAIAGLYARTDLQRGVWKPPAGVAATLAGVAEPAVVLTSSQLDALNPRGINGLKPLPPSAVVCWGARTLRGADAQGDEWKYVPVRRMALHIEQSVLAGCQWAVFEPNAEPLWAKLRAAIGDFLRNLFRQGAFMGSTSAEAYFVKCGTDTITAEMVTAGEVTIVIGFAPLKPAEFVIISLTQMLNPCPT